MSLLLLAALTGAPTSSYTPLDLDNCEIVTVAHAGEGDWSARRCVRGGVTLFINEDDARFDIDAGTREKLLKGLDDVALVLEHLPEIEAFEKRHHGALPWLA